MSQKKVFFFVILFLAGFLLTGCFFANKNNSSKTTNNNATKLSPEQIALQEEKYQQEIKDVLANYWQAGEISGLEQKILDIRAPQKYLDLHLNLVLAVKKIEQGQADNDQVKIDEGKEMINDLKKQYSWIQ